MTSSDGNRLGAGALRAGPLRAPHGSTLAERFAFLSMPEPNSGCILWLGKVDHNGYPHTSVNGKEKATHRVVLQEKLGRELLPTEFACHKCDVKLCINEDHLFAGTHLENMADMRSKGRGPRGERGSLAKLKEAQVRAILADERSDTAVGAAFGVSRRAVNDIRNGKRWAHLSAETRGEPL